MPEFELENSPEHFFFELHSSPEAAGLKSSTKIGDFFYSAHAGKCSSVQI